MNKPCARRWPDEYHLRTEGPAALEQLKLTTALAHLDSVSQQATAQSWSYSHFLGYLLEAELQERHRRTVRLNLQFARFPYQKRLADFDYTAQPGVDRRLVDELATCRFLHDGRSIVFLGDWSMRQKQCMLVNSRAQRCIRQPTCSISYALGNKPKRRKLCMRSGCPGVASMPNKPSITSS